MATSKPQKGLRLAKVRRTLSSHTKTRTIAPKKGKGSKKAKKLTTLTILSKFGD